MGRSLAIMAFLGAAALGGCNLWPFGGAGAAPSAPAVIPPVARPAEAPADAAGHMIAVHPVAKVHLLKLTMPLGTFSLNEKVWRQIDEDALDSRTSVLLAQNGIRAGVGPQSRWPAIAKLIDLPGSTTQEFFCQTDGRTAINIVTRASIPEQTVFYVDKDLQLQGRTFDRCDNAVRLSLNKVKGSTDLTVQVEPIVQVGTIEVLRGAQEMGVVRVTSPQEETFSNLRLTASLKADQFLVIAPADPKAAASAFSVGTRFLSDADKVPALETVLVFVPILEEKK